MPGRDSTAFIAAKHDGECAGRQTLAGDLLLLGDRIVAGRAAHEALDDAH